jgi:hypothetical protein
MVTADERGGRRPPPPETVHPAADSVAEEPADDGRCPHCWGWPT